MPITVNAPNGAKINFPDGTDAATIDSVMSSMGGGAPPAQATGFDANRFGSNMNASASGFLSGMPIIGPTVNDMFNHAEADVRSLVGPETPQQEYELIKQREAADIKANPGTTGAAEVAGGLYAGAAAAPAVGPALAGMSRAGTIATGIGAGAGIGATDSAVRGESALLGAAGGALGGALAPVVGAGIRKAGGAIGNWAAQRGALKGMGLSRESAEAVGNAVDASGPKIGPRLAKAGPNAMVADASPALAGQLDTAIQRGGKVSTKAAERVEQRAAEAGAKADDALTKALGKPEGIATQEEALRQGTKQARKMAYDAAEAQPIDYASSGGMRLESLMKRVPKSALDEANKLMRIEGHQSRQILADIADDGTITFKTMPDVKQIDYITRALNEVAEGAEGRGALGGQTAFGSRAKSLSREMRSTLRSEVPEYGIALDTAADPISKRNALKLGAKMLDPSMKRDVFAGEIKGMSEAEIRHVRQGLRAEADEALANVKRTIMDDNEGARQAMKVLKDFTSPAAKSKIAMIVEPKEFSELYKAIDEVSAALELRASVATNSRTYGRQATERAINRASSGGPLDKLAEGQIPKAGAAVVQTILGTRPADKLAREDRIYGEIVDFLTAPNAAQNLDRLQRGLATKGKSNALSELLALPGAGAAAGGIYQGAKQYTRPKDR